MTEKLDKAMLEFIRHFGYPPAYPPNIDFDQDIYADGLNRCVEDDFDYTIEEYGTEPPTRDDPMEIKID